ncbi:MAG: hypothetical protein ACM3NQ_08545 [Bacteroidales bacterium]
MAFTFLGCWVCALLSMAISPPPPDFHIVVESQFNYLSSTRTTVTETWIAQAKMATKVGTRLTIRREDLGVRWRVDLKAGTYTEEKIAPSPPPSAATEEDIHTAGYDYQAEYDWTTRESGRKSTIVGRPCREFVSSGEADYADASVKFWVCEPMAGVGTAVNDAVLSPMRSASARKMVEETAARRGKAWVLGVEEMQEPPIAPTMVITVSLKAFETAPLPASAFELPANVKKAVR